MKRHRPKSRIAKVDLDAVLKLQRDYTQLECEVQKLFEYAVAKSQGDSQIMVKPCNDTITYIARLIDEMSVKIHGDGKCHNLKPNKDNK